MTILQGVGIGLLALDLFALFFFFTQNSRAGKIKSVPFKKPSEIAQQGMASGDSKQQVSTEGQMGGQPVLAPMSGKPCVYYEIEVTRGTHKISRNAQGQETRSHEVKPVMSETGGRIFMLGDGAGSIGVDCTRKPSFDLIQSHRNRFNVSLVPPSQIQFGNLTVQADSLAANVAGLLLGSETTDYYEGTERIVPFAQGQTMYALGKLTQGPSGLTIGDANAGAVMLSDKGRAAALGTAAKNAQLAAIAGIVFLIGGVVCTVLGFVVLKPAPEHAAPAAAAAKPPAGRHH